MSIKIKINTINRSRNNTVLSSILPVLARWLLGFFSFSMISANGLERVTNNRPRSTLSNSWMNGSKFPLSIPLCVYEEGVGEVFLHEIRRMNRGSINRFHISHRDHSMLLVGKYIGQLSCADLVWMISFEFLVKAFNVLCIYRD